jgi:mRNA-degrading endonuclease toxin of MazEF toxin-antitoxin module
MRPIHVAQLDKARRCDNITTIPAETLRDQIGVLLDDQELQLGAAIRAAFDLD